MFPNPLRHTKPVTIPRTSRQKLTNRDGIELERQFIYAPAETWVALRRLSIAQHRSGSQVIQSLISLADLGKHAKDTNAKTQTRIE